jgi:protein TonB
MMRALRRHWAVGVSVGAHAVAIGALLLRFDPAPTAASGAIAVAMTMPALEPASESPDARDVVTAAAAPAAQKAVEPLHEVAQPVEAPPEAVQAIEPEVATKVPLERPVVAEAVPDVIRSESVDATEAIPPPPPARPKVAKPQPHQPTEEPAVARAEPAGAASSEPAKEADNDPSPPTISEARLATQAAAGRAGPPPDYLNTLRIWLERHKEYPRRAQLRGQEGTALLRFTIDERGRVLSHRIERGTGHPTLDREVEAMIRRADPLPAPPPEMRQDRLELVVPVQFYLR